MSAVEIDHIADFRRSVRAFVADQVSPRAEEFDQHGVFPRDVLEALGAGGMLGLRYPEADGGEGGNFRAACVMYEELAYGSLSIAAICAMQSLMGTHFVHRFGTEDQRARYFRPALRGAKVAAFALTEPGAGSDLGAMQTTAVRADGGWVIDGTKTWITNAPVADFITVGARTQPGRGMEGISLFLVDAANPAFEVGRPIEKLGVRSSLTSEVSFNSCHVTDDALLGTEGSAASQLRELLAQIRVMTAALGLGLGRRALDDSRKYASERVAFGKPIEAFQAIQIKLADMAAGLYAAELMVRDCAEKIDLGEDVSQEAAMAKLLVTEHCATVVDEATRIHGSYGFAMEYAAQRYFRDARFLLSGGGTSELLRGLIAKGLRRER